MIEYPPRTIDGRYAPAHFPRIPFRRVPGTDEDDQRAAPVTFHAASSSRGESVRPPVRIELGVTKLELKGGGKTSRAFNDGVNGRDGVGAGAEGFHWCPSLEDDDLEIAIEVHHRHNIRSAKLELYCRDLRVPVCTKLYGQAFGDGDDIADLVGKGQSDGATSQTLGFTDVFEIPDDLTDPERADDGPLFVDGHLTVARSPYRVQVTVSARAEAGDSQRLDRYAYPTVAWTHTHALVESIELCWGKHTLIPTARPDVPMTMQPFVGRGRPDTEAQLAARQKKTLDALAEAAPTVDADVPINGAVYLYDDLAPEPDKEEEYFAHHWGEGPRLPLLAKVKVKKLDGSGATCPEALGRLRFLWDWQDTVDETRTQRLDAWTGAADAPRDERTTRITRYFLDQTFERYADARFPKHGFNCPAQHGGKRGHPHPGAVAAKVFPEQTGADTFPFAVRTAQTRRWAAWTEAHQGAVDRNDAPVSTGVLFSPAAISGDRYRVSVWVDPGIGDLDRDLRAGSWFDLEEHASNVPHAVSGLFTVKRTMQGAYYSTPSFHADIATTIDAITGRLRRELGYDCTLASRPFPTFAGNLADKLAAEVAARPGLHNGAAGKALLLHATTNAAGAADADYAYTVVADSAEHKTNVERYFLERPITTFEYVDALSGHEIHGAAARAVVLQDRGPGDDLSIAVHLNDGAFGDAEKVRAMRDPISDVDTAQAPRAIALRLDVEVEIPENRRDRNQRRVFVRCPALDAVDDVELRYGQGRIRATRHLSDGAQAQLDAFLAQVRDAHDDTEPLTFTIAGTQDPRGVQRTAEVKAYLEQRVLCREALLAQFWRDTVWWLPSHPPDDDDARVRQGLEMVTINTLNPAWRGVFNTDFVTHTKAAAENAGWQEDGRAVFYHLRGRTKLDKTYTTGGIENTLCEERFGISGLTVPAVTADQKVEKRWLKSEVAVAVHEFGHTLLLPHQLARAFDAKVPPKTQTSHLAHDACLMNYDPDTTSFCAYCILRKRGWSLGGLERPDLGHATAPAWAGHVKTLMEADVAADDDDVAAKARLAMFLLGADGFLNDGVDRTDDAIVLMEAARAKVPVDHDDPVYIWLQRNLYIFYRNIERGAERDAAKLALENASDKALDRDVLKGGPATAVLGSWLAAPP